jgi:hypothetical protein
VLASFIRVAQKTNKATGSMPYLGDNLWVAHYRNVTDAQVDNIMAPNSEMDRAIFSIANLLKNHKDRVHVVWFDDLLTNPTGTLESIHEFLGLDLFDYNFNNIKAVDSHDDLAGYGILGLHDVGKKLTKPKTKVEDYLSKYSIRKYGNALDFLNL